jgi:hypothetical protein
MNMKIWERILNALAAATLLALVTSCSTTAPGAGDLSKAPVRYTDNPREEYYPDWSWDRVQVWVPIRYHEAYTDEMIEKLAAHQIVMLEKANGHAAYGSVEKGTLAAAERIKKINPDCTTFFYWNACIKYGGYDANAEFDANEADWAMHRKDTGEVVEFRTRWRYYNLAVPAMREWWVKTALEMVDEQAIDGVFIDAIMQIDLAGYKIGNRVMRAPEKAEGYWLMAEDLRRRMPEDKLLVANALRVAFTENGNIKHLDYLDGSYLENWTFHAGRNKTAEDHAYAVAGSIEVMQEALKMGRIIMLTSGPMGAVEDGKFIGGKKVEYDNQADKLAAMRQQITFPLAVFLTIVEPYAYFSYHAGVDANPARENIWDNNLFDELKRPLGRPLGPYTRDGYVFTRKFTNLEVMVNVMTKEAKITWYDFPEDPNYRPPAMLEE